MYQHYYHTGFGYRLTSGIKNLIIINSIIFLLQLFGLNNFIKFLGLTPVLVYHKLMLWQLVTYMFLHGDIFHILFNMLALWMFGSTIEARWGTKKFVRYYFLCGIGGGIATCLLSPNSIIPSIGASASIFGILVAYGMMFPNSIVLLFGLFPMKARHFVILFGAIELLACLRYTPDGIGHFAHLGGMVVGYLYLKNILNWNRITGSIAELKKKREKESIEKKQVDLQSVKEHIDVLLDKISSQGIDSLSKEEQDFLKKASRFLQEHN
ncbi:MAG: rhomboid family intramembrane serine protease [bacterium]